MQSKSNTGSSQRDPQLTVIRELDALVHAHMRWLNDLNETLLCGEALEADARDANHHGAEDFQRWHRELAKVPLLGERLKRIETLHGQMHTQAQGLLHGPKAPAINAADYRRFVNTTYLFKTTVRALEYSVMQNICLVDHLTGVWNRSAMFARLSEEYDRVLRFGDSCCICMMDIDHFKEVNDRYGHGIGDQVLQEVVAVARQSLRRFDSIFRYGGEEFLLCLPKASLRDSIGAMERICADIATTPFVISDGKSIAITASFGVAELSGALSIEENVETADRALLRAKAAGRNRVACHGDGIA